MCGETAGQIEQSYNKLRGSGAAVDGHVRSVNRAADAAAPAAARSRLMHSCDTSSIQLVRQVGDFLRCCGSA